MSDLSPSSAVFHDPSSRAQLNITYDHAAVHRDIIAGCSQRFTGTAIVLHIKSPTDRDIHLKFAVESDGQSNWQFYKDADVTADGTPVKTYRLNFNSEKVTGLEIFSAPTVNDNGEEIIDLELGTTNNVGGRSAVHEDAEFLLKRDTSYLITLNAAQSRVFSFQAGWYEVNFDS